MRFTALVTAMTLAFAANATAQEGHQPYKGFETRDITSLSDDDITALSEGAGWGLALPAELNGYPGPAHVLELADALGLTTDQRDAVTGIVAEMRAEAIAAGQRLIEAERALDGAFEAGDLDPETLDALIAAAEAARAELRFVHLSRHLVTRELLKGDQVAAYDTLRGYRPDDPCTSVPEGHDATMWRRHNGCDG